MACLCGALAVVLRGLPAADDPGFLRLSRPAISVWDQDSIQFCQIGALYNEAIGTGALGFGFAERIGGEHDDPRPWAVLPQRGDEAAAANVG
jgi:hypothetical protein